MSASLFDSQAVGRQLEALQAELTDVANHPELARAYGERLSQIGARITAACEREFLRLLEKPAA